MDLIWAAGVFFIGHFVCFTNKVGYNINKLTWMDFFFLYFVVKDGFPYWSRLG